MKELVIEQGREIIGKGKKIDEKKEILTDSMHDNDEHESFDVTSQSSDTLGDEIMREVRNAIDKAMGDAQERVKHFTTELDKRIDYMYKNRYKLKRHTN